MLISYETLIGKLCQERFKTLMHQYFIDYQKPLDNVCRFISNVDFLTNITEVSKTNGYCRPTINKIESSYLKATNLRHPIIEKIHDKVKYVPNDIHLGTDNQNGILLYGVNAVGKSSLMKSVGIAIIMAQMGSYVPATSFEFSPYRHIFTRISSNDNIFKGQSTFAVEMSELRSILTRANKHSLILGDELCSGTETTSGISIVTAGVMRLSSKDSSFIFATHLHKLSKMEEIKECQNVHNYHMETIFDRSLHTLVYNRKLKPGSGNAIYGLEVARAMDLDDEFILTAEKIRKKLMGQTSDIVQDRSSNYNSKLVVSKCEICGEPATEGHHIEEQHLANDTGMIDYFHKNNLFNLMCICEKHHQEVHHGKLRITGFVDTLDGVKLKYSYKDEVPIMNKKKYNQEQVSLVIDKYHKLKNYSSVKRLISTQNNLNISLPTIKKMVAGEY